MDLRLAQPGDLEGALEVGQLVLGDAPEGGADSLELDDGDCRVRCGVEIRMVNKGESYTVAGHYLDTYRKVDGHWRFAHRDFRTYHWVPLRQGWAGTA